MPPTLALRPATLQGLRHITVRAGPAPAAAAAASRPPCRAAPAAYRQPLAAAPASRAGAPAAAALPRETIRRYSQQQQQQQQQQPAASKVWSFEQVQKLATQAKPEVVIVDVREPEELQATGRIPHAVNVPVVSAADSFHITAGEFVDRFGFGRPDKAQEVVFYCKAGVRSRTAAGLARDAGWTRVGEYPGSWLDWTAKGGEVEK